MADALHFLLVMMRFGQTYIEGDSAVHRCDARVKIVVLLAFSIAVVALPSRCFLAVCCVAVVGACVAAHIPAGKMNRSLIPVYVLAAFSVLFNVLAAPGASGLATGLFLGVRMVVLVAASFVVCLTTTVSELLEAFAWLIRPLRRVRVPADDIAFTLALSVRFIPVIELEFARIRAAQVSRGAEASPSALHRLRVWGSAFSALFIGLFRHADALASAMDARCYGAVPARTRLAKRP